MCGGEGVACKATVITRWPRHWKGSRSSSASHLTHKHKTTFQVQYRRERLVHCSPRSRTHGQSWVALRLCCAPVLRLHESVASLLAAWLSCPDQTSPLEAERRGPSATGAATRETGGGSAAAGNGQRHGRYNVYLLCCVLFSWSLVVRGVGCRRHVARNLVNKIDSVFAYLNSDGK